MADLIPVHALINGGVILHYFRTSDVYLETGGLGEKVGIKKIKEADLNGNEEIVPVKELLRSGAMHRISIRHRKGTDKKKSAKILVSSLALPGVFGDVPAARLEGTEYKFSSETTARGNITNISGLRRATFY
jgi:hypothetical protein